MRPWNQLLLIIFFVPGIKSASQPPVQQNLDSLAGALIQNLRITETAQGYVVTDKSIYQSGEPVWARAFLLNSYSNKINTNHSLIAELINKEDSTIKHLLLDARNQRLTVRIQVPASLSSGFYWLRVYTPEMIRDNHTGIYAQPIYVINPYAPEKSRNYEATIFPPIKATFYPEGGSIMTGTNSVVAYRITDANNNPVKVSGTIKDNRDVAVVTFSSNVFGIGKFEFFPYRARRYTVHIQYEGKEYQYPLPPFNFFAGQLSLKDANMGSRRARILLEDSLYKKDYITYLYGVSGDSLCFAGIGKGNYELNIPFDRFPKGIATLYLFNQNNELLSERSFYVPDESVTVVATLDKNVYPTRSKGKLSIVTTNRLNQPVQSSLSISIAAEPLTIVEDASSLHTTLLNQDHLLARRWAIEAAELPDDSVLDLLMLIKPSSFVPFKNSVPVRSMSDSLLFLRGRLIATPGKSIAGKTITLIADGRSDLFETAVTDASGMFLFEINNYTDSTRFNAQVTDANGKPENIEILMDKVRLPRPIHQLPYRPEFDVPSSTISAYLRKWETVYTGSGKEWLQPVLVRSKKKNELLYEGKRVSSSSFIIPQSAFEKGGLGSIRNAVLGVPGLSLNKGYLVIRGLNSAAEVSAASEPLVSMNGIVVQVSGGDAMGVSPVLSFLNSLNPGDIEFIEILRGPESANYGLRGSNGVIEIHTMNNMKPETNSKNNFHSFYAHGYHNPPMFQSPNYDIKELKNGQHTDSRSTLYWNGYILTNEKGKVELPFFTNDVPGNYMVTIRGITARGDIIYETIKFIVK